MKSAYSEEEFIEICNRLKSPTAVAKETGVAVRGVHARMRRLEEKGILFVVNSPLSERSLPDANPARLSTEIQNGIVLVGSDAHYIPGQVTVAHRAFVKLVRELKPLFIVMNGDAFDGGSISRFPRIGWDDKPLVVQELEACKDRLGEIEDAAKGRPLIWPLGNHDSRMECRLAAVAPEFEGIKGFALKDHFPAWKPCWSFFINNNVVIKHRIRGGIHATRNNVIAAGRSTVTGHLHSLKVTPYSDYNGCRWGVDSGTLAEPYGDQFRDYTEDSPLDWRSGFAVLTFYQGHLFPPELCQVINGEAIFRGRIIAL